MKDLIIGIDCSTSACKALVFDAAGICLAEGRAPLGLNKPQPGWHEQDAADWWRAACAALHTVMLQIDPARLAGISLSIQRETFVPVDAAGVPLRPAILWMDTRAEEYLAPLAAALGLERFQHCTGKRLSVNLAPPKLRWLAQEEPGLFHSAAQFWDVHAALTHDLTGEAVSAWGSAGPLGLFDLRRRDWSEAVLSACGIRREQLPRLAAPGERVGVVSARAAAASGLPAGLPVFAGIGDGQACGLGAGITQPGSAYLTLGTSVISGCFASEFAVSDAFRTMMGGERGTYLLETVLLGGTYTLDWFLQDFLGRSAEDALADLSAEAALLPPGAEGLVLLPYWNSAMNPYWDEHARGVILGWRGCHRPAHVLRAILEGIAFEVHLQSRGVETATGERIREWVVMGGGSRSDLWCQIIADVSGRTVRRAAEREAAALGAAMLAAVGVGLFPDVCGAAQAMVRTAAGQVFQPDASHHALYADLYQTVYLPLYPALKEIMKHLPG